VGELGRVDDASVAFFGLDGASGEYLLTAEPAQVSAMAQAEVVEAGHLSDLRARLERAKPSLGVAETVEDPADLAQAGWGVVFADDVDPAIEAALAPLLQHRAAQARAADERFFQVYRGARGYHRGESKHDFLRARGAAPSGPADPQQMPYYLLLVGGPSAIPYALQYQLDVQYAVGRIAFATPDGYARYAQSVVAAERANPRPRRAALVGVANPDDLATQLSAQHLVAPLAERLRDWQLTSEASRRWQVDLHLETEATRARFEALLGGAETPGLLLTASHGVGFPSGDVRQATEQGALVTQEWAGPHGGRGPLPRAVYVAAEDVPDTADVAGLVAFCFACFGAGTPRLDDFPELATTAGLGDRLARPMAPSAFVARLPVRLLGHPRGGALAVVGHVERALGASFLWNQGSTRRSNLGAFEAALRRLMRGQPVGLALEAFNQRYAELCADLRQAVRQVTELGRAADDQELAQLWMGSTDARGYVILGDPAVRLAGLGAGAGDATTATAATLTAAPPVEPAQARVPVAVAAPPAGAGQEAQESTTTMTLPVTGATGVRIDVEAGTGHITVRAPTGSGTLASGADPLAGEPSYGLFGGSKDDAEAPAASLAAGVRGLAEQLTAAVARVAADVSTLSVSTYTTEDLGAVTYDVQSHTFTGPAVLRAFTSIRLDGETVALVPQQGGAVDDRLWSIHTDMVARAQAHRAEFLRAAAAAASSLLSAVRGV